MNLEVLGRFAYTEEQRDRWRSGLLPERWQAAYPELFDEDDLRITRNQPDNHFFEWLAAIHVYHATGWLSLVEKYAYANHPRKQAIFHELFDVAWASEIEDYDRWQLPDLLLYRPDRSEFRFCEVKGRHDRLRPEQARYFEEVRRVTGRPIYVVEYREMKLGASDVRVVGTGSWNRD